jgi:predicted metal-binding protein
VTARDAEVDRILLPKPVAAALTRRRRCAHRDRVEVGVEEVKCVGGCERPCQLGVERASARQGDDVREAA